MSGIATVLRVAVSFVLAADAVAVSFPLAGAGPIALAPIVLLYTGAITLFVAMPAYLVLRPY